MRASSAVNATVGGKVAKNLCVWTDKGPLTGQEAVVFTKCIVLPDSDETTVSLRPVDSKLDQTPFKVPVKQCFNANDNDDVEAIRDIGSLVHENTAAVLDLLRQRYLKDQIYDELTQTTADPLLIAINPFRDLGNCRDSDIKKYKTAPDLMRLQPHTFGISRQAVDSLFTAKKSQAIVVTGESGAGKTEATKHCMRYFAFREGMSGESDIQKAIMAANPVLEAFGNAKTSRNNNSSRFGRFMMLQLAAKGGIEYGTVKGFLLEKVRVVSQEADERSYHIFYQLAKSLPANLKSRYKLLDISKYKSLLGGGTYDAPGIDDSKEYQEVCESFLSMQLSESEIDSIWSIVSGVLLLGNVTFESVQLDGVEAAAISDVDEKVLQDACELLFMANNTKKVSEAFLVTERKVGSEVIRQRVSSGDAQMLKESLCKAYYNQLFQWIIARLNSKIEPPSGFDVFMGMLDIFGFEVFDHNSLEQLLINVTNEFLQKNFTDVVFEKESRIYREEGVATTELRFTSNAHIIDALIGKRGSVFSALEDACVAKGNTDSNFVSVCSRTIAKNVFSLSNRSKTSFKITHTISDIEYDAAGFIGKNMDLLKADLAECCHAAESPVVTAMFSEVEVVRGKLAKGQLIASQFLKQLDEMMSIILSTEPHFIRCLKPNDTKKYHDFHATKVLNQLFSLSILEALQLKKVGFSYKRGFFEFAQQFRFVNMGITNDINAAHAIRDMDRVKQLAVALCTQMSQDKKFTQGKEWEVGKTMIFLKSETQHAFLAVQRLMLQQYEPLVNLIEAMWELKSLKETAKCRHRPTVRVQAHARKTYVQRCRQACAPMSEVRSRMLPFTRVMLHGRALEAYESFLTSRTEYVLETPSHLKCVPRNVQPLEVVFTTEDDAMTEASIDIEDLVWDHDQSKAPRGTPVPVLQLDSRPPRAEGRSLKTRLQTVGSRLRSLSRGRRQDTMSTLGFDTKTVRSAVQDIERR
ncbi:MAG: hypothetical protein KVP17_000609 [Porospora cf. gigantea B]|uniref:uncharacterized protein n=1 Tax=Porospora cf. gigantea B TaxID=2853592 RepID=UPI003571D2A9|nr:MAG: hypothetical protein KVP17_000609 [Porospora cf. gigantea B]